jgi:hypothetical protein
MGGKRMSAVFDDAKSRALHEQARGFTTVPTTPAAGVMPEYSSSSLGGYVRSAFMTGAVIVYALHGEQHDVGESVGGKVLPLRGAQVFPLIGETDTSTMSLGSAWVASEPEVYNSGVLKLPWERKVIYSRNAAVKTSQLPRRAPRTIIADFLDEENG